MGSVQGLFRDFHRTSRRLSDELRRRHLAPMIVEIQNLTAADLERSDQDLVTQLLDRVELRPPKLLGTEVASSRDREGDRRPGSDANIQVETNRHFVAIEVEGDVSLLECWPDDAEDLQPIDDFEINPWSTDRVPDPYDEREAVRRHKMRQVLDLWQVHMRTSDDETRALYTFVDLTYAEELLVASGALDVRAEVDRNRLRIEPIVDAIRDQCERFLAETVVPELSEAIVVRRQRSSARSIVRESLSWSDGWRPKPPALDLPPSVGPSEVGEAPIDLRLPSEARLNAGSFADIQRVIRLWADSAERTPDAFGDLSEDHLSDLLATVLNSHAPGTGREVYSKKGKTDIYIRGDALQAGAAPAKVFILEAKWWDGPAKANEALDQLLGYLEAKDTSAILLFYVDRVDSGAVRHRCRRVLSDRPDFVAEEQGPVDGWTVMRFSNGPNAVALAVCFVDLAVGDRPNSSR